MSLRNRILCLCALIAVISAITGFFHWTFFLPVAFVGAVLFSRAKLSPYSVLLSAAATAFGWVLVALGRDLIESGRLSTKLAGFLNLPHGLFMYLALFILCLVPSLFAAWSGAAFSDLQANKRED